MNITIFLVLTTILFPFKASYSQDKCACCTYNSIDDIALFDEFFSPETINKNGITYAIVYTTEQFGDTIHNYLQAKFTFNKKYTNVVCQRTPC